MIPRVPVDSRHLTTLLVALVFSGAAGLTYQVLWLRLLSLVFGVTAYAASTVLAGFMAGLAIGSILGGRLASRTARPLRAFALAELAIAATALLTHRLLGHLPAAYTAVVHLTGDHVSLLTLARLAGTLLVLIVPTTIMGATLPLVSASRVIRTGRPAARIAAAYGINTTGAIIGAVLAGFHFVGSLGIAKSFWLAAAANLLAAAVAWVLSRQTERGSDSADTDPATPDRAPTHGAGVAPGTDTTSAIPPATAARVRGAVLIALGVSGLASLALEVVWFRILVLFVPATTYAFTTMLAAVLGGIASGSIVAARLLRRNADWVRILALMQAGISLVILGSLAVLAWSYGAGYRTAGSLQASGLAIFPASLLMGMSFPIGVRLWTAGDSESGVAVAPQRVGREVGTIYAINVCGAIVGAIAGGFVLLPLLGSRLSLIVCAALYMGCAGVLAWAADDRRRIGWLVAAAAVPFVALALLVPDPFRATLERRYGSQERILWQEEGIQTTVSVHQQRAGQRVLYLDGLHQANDSPEMLRVHRQIGHLPMMVHPDPRRVLVIGLGGGATAGAVAQHTTARVDIVELSASVRRGAAFFAHANYHVLEQPNVQVRVDDGRNYLLTTDRRYDVLTADIIQPVHAGAGLLYSVEYFRLARNVLSDDGVMLQWVGLRPNAQYKLIVRSFLEAFPETTSWAGGTLLIGSKRPLVLSRAAFERRRQLSGAREALDAIGLHSFETLLSWYVAGPRALHAFIGPGDLLRDDRPQIEYHRSLPIERGVIDLTPLKRPSSELHVVD